MTQNELRELAAWAERAARWLELSARGPNDDDDPTIRTVVFDAATLDDLLTGFRGVPGVLQAIAASLDQRRDLRVIAGGRR